jgi:hypothetical protein
MCAACERHTLGLILRVLNALSRNVRLQRTTQPMNADAPTNDTSPETERMQIEIYRKMSPSRKWELLDGLYRMAREFHAAGVRMNRPQATEEEVLTAWLRATLDDRLFHEVQQYRDERARRAI